MKYKVEIDWLIRSTKPTYKIMYHNKMHNLWLTYSVERFESEEEALKAIKKIEKDEQKRKINTRN